ncbi:hypothetical protein [Polaribacter glomeratus]|uniref:Tetratricopeptide repeat protein n=1 Tax=Polaribacter glomeratus TaxID=102 RepID=A0A2S7WGG4_9FLAO|nr:hypothetical protein [Polaribacter glomeratus]PQJ76704.1 hypothetical protein BTO16_12535 [Polaribacter glomeratus]TXD67454.1 hypothetical protein ESX12_02380 [Polaribacter glomeratus]
MPGEGSIQGMLTSLSNNKRLLRKKNMFRPERTFLSLKRAYIKSAGGEIELKKATKKQLRAIRIQIIRERRKNWHAFYNIFLFLFLIVGFITYNFIQNYTIAKEKTKKIELDNKIERSLLLIAKGDYWLKKRSWYNAIFEYKRAFELLPNDYTVYYRLAHAYSLRCENEFEDCKKGKKLLDKLINQFPEKSELLELEELLKYEN